MVLGYCFLVCMTLCLPMPRKASQRLHHQIQTWRKEIGLRLIHHSYATVTGAGEQTDMRLKYVELWFSASLADAWEVQFQSQGRFFWGADAARFVGLRVSLFVCLCADL